MSLVPVAGIMTLSRTKSAATCSARRTGSISGAPRLIQSAIGYECMKCVENAVPPGKNPPVEIWTVRLLFTRWNF